MSNVRSERIMEIVSDVGYLKSSVKSLDERVRDHMEGEEKKVKEIHTYLRILAFVIILDWMGMSGPEIVKLISRALF